MFVMIFQKESVAMFAPVEISFPTIRTQLWLAQTVKVKEIVWHIDLST